MKISGDVNDLRQLLFFAILAAIAQVFLLVVLACNEFVIIVCVMLDLLFLIVGIVDWFYFSRKIVLDKNGCTFVSIGSSKKFAWEEVYLQHTQNSSFLFGDSEILGEGVILSAKPISKPKSLGAMTYCRFTHPKTSVFIRFKSPCEKSEKIKDTSAKFVYKGFAVEKDKILDFLSNTSKCL